MPNIEHPFSEEKMREELFGLMDGWVVVAKDLAPDDPTRNWIRQFCEGAKITATQTNQPAVWAEERIFYIKQKQTAIGGLWPGLAGIAEIMLEDLEGVKEKYRA